jgi:hypothetical protein
MSPRVVGACAAATVALSSHVWLQAQVVSPHGAANSPLQPGPKVNAVGGIVELSDPAAPIKVDLNEQRQNETVAAHARCGQADLFLPDRGGFACFVI